MGNWWDSRSNAFRLVAVCVTLFLFLAALVSVLGLAGAGLRTDAVAGGASTSAGTATPVVPKTSSTPARTPSPSATTTQRTSATGDAVTFLGLLAELTEDNEPWAHTGYERDLFNVWNDANRDGCDTRAEVLKSESASAVSAHGSCTIDSGSWYSAYDGVWFTDAGEIDIDHFVPLKEAWVSGAWQWTSSTRTAFGNDLGYAASLIAVSASSNRSKSDSDPAEWLPRNTDFYCDYAATWVAVKWRWSLTVDSLERATVARLLNSCSSLSVVVPERANVAINPNAVDGVAPVGGGGSGDGVVDPDFGTCSNAKANGYGPYIRGVDPEYDFYRDGDNDGTVCE